jgi:D-3-phosphoglycerate dehydrogenase
MKILVATEKPFAKEAIEGIRAIASEKGYELALLEKYTSSDDLKAEVKDADALIVRSDKVTNEIIEAAQNLKIVVRAGAGYDNLDLEACSQKGVVAMNTPGQNSNAVAELAIGMMIYISRNQFTPGTGSELKDKSLGIHAFGNVGRLVASLAKGFGMKVFAFDPFVKEADITNSGVTPVGSIEELYEKSDFLSLHIPATTQTRNSVGTELIEKLPKNGCLVNTARKEIIDEEGLIEALKKREDIKYVTDIATDNHDKIKEMFGNRVFATPKKMGAQTAEANINAGVAAARQIVNFLENGDKTFQVN